MRPTKEMNDLIQQGEIVGAMMLTITAMILGDYRGKGIGKLYREWLAAFVLWREDTLLNPMTYTEVANVLGVPPTSMERACDAVVAKGLALQIDGKYARNVEYLVTRLDSSYFRSIRRAIIEAGKALEKVFGNR